MAAITIGMVESVHEKDDNSAPWRSRLQARFGRGARHLAQPLGQPLAEPGDWIHESGPGLGGEALLHSERMEKMRLALPRLWTLVTGTARLLLLTAFLLPATALWVSAWPNQRFDARIGTFLLALCVATLAQLLVRWRARNLSAFALLLCSGVAVATMLLALVRDTWIRLALHGATSTQLWLPGSLLGWGAQSMVRGATRTEDVHLSGPDAIYLAGAALVCGAAIVTGAQLSRRELFHRAPLDVRQVHPLNAPISAASRAQLRLLWMWLFLGMVLALRPLVDAPAVAFLLTLAASLAIWGWHRKALGAKEISIAMLGAVVAGFSMLLLWLVSAPVGPTATLQNLRVWSRSLNMVPLTLLQGALDNKIVFAAAVAALGAVLVLLKRQPPHLWSVLGYAPVWGWVALGGMSILPLAVLLPAGSCAALALAVALLPALLFVWLEGA
jgi:hypothetical protein